MPARSKRIWLGATASAGVSLSVGIRAFVQRTRSILLGNRGKPFLPPVRTRQAASHRANNAVYQIDPPGRRAVWRHNLPDFRPSAEKPQSGLTTLLNFRTFPTHP